MNVTELPVPGEYDLGQLTKGSFLRLLHDFNHEVTLCEDDDIRPVGG